MVKDKEPKIDVIGSVELVSFPESKVSDVPARVDTGAIYSSIWASNVKVRGGVLSFSLFAPGSALYSGEKITTTTYRTSSVKNSFGHSEFRFKVRLQVKIGERKIRAWFSLADRAGMTYPVLLGRNILRRKFVVDVSKHKTHGNTPAEVLVLASDGHIFDEYFKKLEAYSNEKIHYAVRDYKDLIFSLESGRVNVVENVTNKNIGDFDLVYFKSHKRDYAVAIAAAQYASFRGAKIVDQELLSQISYDKLSEYMRLALHELPIPYTFCAPTKYLVEHIEEIAQKTGWPLICKEIESDRGHKNYIFDDAEELRQTLQDAADTDIYVVQKYIPNDGFMRTIVLDREVGLGIRRAAVERDEKLKRHLNKKPYSDNVTLVKLESLCPEVHDLSVRSAVVMNRQVAGVDLIQDTGTKKWFILEVNNAPQIKSGPFLEERMRAVAAFFDRELYY